MKKSELKKLIKPLVKECIQETLIEEGLLSNIVAEVAKGLQGNLVVENVQTKQEPTLVKDDLQMKRKSKEARAKLNEHRQKLMDSIGASSYNGVDIFEGVQPASPAQTQGAVDLGQPGDAGVDIDSLMNNASQIWKAMNKQDIK